MEEGYGPMNIEVELLIAMADSLDDERIAKIADAYRAAGFPHAMFAVVAAKQAGRHEQACNAMRDVAASVSIFGMTYEYNPRDLDLAVWAARNAGYALATEDLIGSFAYSPKEYANLVEPWYAGFVEREEER